MAGSLQCILMLLTLSSFHVLACSSNQLLYVYIDADSGEDTTECLNSNSISKACRSLSFVAENLTQTELVTIEIKSQYLNLTKPVVFDSSYNHLNITGYENTILHCNTTNAGLAFESVMNLAIQSVTIDHCGTLRESTSIDLQKPDENEHLSVAVYLLNCTDVTIQSVGIKSSNGTGLSMYDTNGTVSIEYCNFTDNNIHKLKGGGGLHIEFTYCSPGNGVKCSCHNGRNRHSTYIIQKCNFWNNVAIGDPHSKGALILPPINYYPKVGKGGGMFVSIESDAMGNNFTIDDCHFHNNSADYVAGGMLIEFLNSVRKNLIFVYDTFFVNNSCPSEECTGGGLAVGLMFYNFNQLIPTGNIFLCRNCTFEGNSAPIGGGTTVAAAKVVNYTATCNNITFIHCKWIKNASPLGAAVCVLPGAWDYTGEGFLPKPLFSDCTFVLNSASQTIDKSSNGLNTASIGYGAMFVEELRVILEGKTNFIGNNGSAVYLSSSVLEFHEGSNVIFHKNRAHKGGAIAMFGSSVLHINNDSTFNFTNNMAYSTGGAIYADVPIARKSAFHNCFIWPGLHQKNSDFYFVGNQALRNGNSIFATSFRPCKSLCPGPNDSIKHLQKILQCIANFYFCDKKGNTSLIATYPYNFTLDTPVMMSPGSEYHLPLTVTDEGNNTLSGIVYEATTLSSDVMVDPAFSQVSNNTICITGNIGDKAVLHLDTVDITLSFNITLVDCKPGYIQKKHTCECAASDYLGLVTCNPKVLLRHGYWMGFCAPNSSKLCTSYCPYGFCSYHQMNSTSLFHPLPDNSSKLDYDICGPSRTGRLCGRCADNHSVYFHSSKYTCGPEGLCHWGWFFYLISEIFPVTLLFIIIIVFNVSFTNGSVNCFIFYAQILSALATNGNGSIKFPYPLALIKKILTFFYRPLNLDFFSLEELSFCLWRGATVLDAMIMKYTTVGFSLVLVVLTIFIARRKCRGYKILTKFNTPDSVLIHGLSAFFVLCYSQCARVTFHILTSFCLYSFDFKCEEKVVNRIGDMNYFEGDHVKYAIVAIFILVFMIIIPPVLLMIYPLLFKLLGLCKLSESKLAGILWRVMPIQLLDAFQSSFKDNMRFFAGLYFLYRGIILGFYALCPTILVFYCFVELQLILIMALHATFQPYKGRKHNIIDLLLFTNLAVINTITLYTYAHREYKIYTTGTPILQSIQAFLILLPFLCILALGVHKLMLGYKKWRNDRRDFDGLPSLRSSESDSLIQKW